MGFAGHIHCHDMGSPLDGAGTPSQLAHEAWKKGQTHLNRTNHGRIGTALEHIHACRHPEKYDDPDNEGRKRPKDSVIIPAVGIEAFWRDNRHNEEIKSSVANHLTLTASGLEGWRNLMRLSSAAWVRREKGGGFYGKPCIDWELYERYAEGLIVSSACISSPLAQRVMAGEEAKAIAMVKRFQRISKGNFWIEIMPHDFADQRTLNIGLVNIAYETGAPIIATGDVHVPYKEWADTHSVLRMISYRQTLSTAAKKKDAGEDTYTEEIDSVYLSSEDEMRDMFVAHHPDLPLSVVQESLDNTKDFFRSIQFYVVGKAKKLPKVDQGVAERAMKDWIEEGFKRLWEAYPKEHWDKYPMDTYLDRKNMEFDVLKAKGVLDYFYITADFVRWARSDRPLPIRDDKGRLVYPEGEFKKPIRVGLGRGSAAGCLISYLIGITAIDPISWGLLFERFLNPDRVGMPDIDIDFMGGDEGRELVKQYLRVRWGHDHVADIIAFSTFAPRAVIEAVTHTQDADFKYVKKVKESIGDTERNLAKIAAQNPDVAKLRDDHPEWWKHMIRLEDQRKGETKHAGGVLITDRPVTDYMPTQKGNDDISVVTAWADTADFPVISDYGFVKWDILGVKGLDKQQLCVDYIKENYSEDIEPNMLAALRDPHEGDQRVLDAFVHGLTVGVFQFGGRGITSLLRAIKPTSAIDIAVANALYRPGPIKIAYEYADRKNGKTPVTYWHDALEPSLSETLGLIAFQEQVMRICVDLGNFTGGQADAMRKAISKLYRLPGDEAKKFMQGFYDTWIAGCTKNGISEGDANKIWNLILEFGDYGFNKSHSASYALQAYQDMWLKVNYPIAFYASVLSIDKKNKRAEQEDFLRSVMREAKLFGIDTLPPNVNKSRTFWVVEGQNLRYGLASVSDMGASDSEKLIRERERNGDYRSFEDFITRLPTAFPVSSGVALAKGGAFDSIDDRNQLLTIVSEYEDARRQFKIVMDCGCRKVKTIKPAKDDDGNITDEVTDDEVEIALSKIECKKHPQAKIQEYEEEDLTYTMAHWIKENPDREDLPQGRTPSRDELLAMETEALFAPLSTGNTVSDYHEFIEKRVFTEAEIEALPGKPRKARGRHEPSECVVGGEVTNVKVITTKKKKEQMAFVDVVFGTNNYNLTVFPFQYRKYHALLKKATALFFLGNKDDVKGGIIVRHIDDVVEVANEVGWEPPNKVIEMPRQRAQFRTTKRKIKRKKVA